jgi:hypothetical protein
LHSEKIVPARINLNEVTIQFAMNFRQLIRELDNMTYCVIIFIAYANIKERPAVANGKDAYESDKIITKTLILLPAII